MSPISPSGEIQLLDQRGCLTPEVMCFIDELHPDQQAVVDRHLRACLSCAQEQASMARAANKVRRARPRIDIPSDVRLLAQQTMLRSLLTRRLKSARSISGAMPWYRRTSFWVVVISALMTALAAAIVVLFTT